MKKRFVYSILLGIPGAFISFWVSSFFAYIIWMAIGFGGGSHLNLDTIANIILFVSFVVILGLFIAIGFVIGRKLEKNPRFNKLHFLVPIIITIPLAIFTFKALVSNFQSSQDLQGQFNKCKLICEEEGYSRGGSLGGPAGYPGNDLCNCYNMGGSEGWFNIETSEEFKINN
ncbi:MAG: hypothetical protein ABIH38_00390 [Patescibacteria group bacterium]